ncbi:unnamed protein product [Zymoseptoria tritici ST99CH_1A5]|uniref:Uncharacterized protein n=1 Tax=Zymoseptoria tritici ST99CH_1A5 TaxID=1276529 RepID=A0A1Y6L2H9_ZYMTR|nr:unnamed protein product [Zymoseptoria tritici ST99CH_1A5]
MHIHHLTLFLATLTLTLTLASTIPLQARQTEPCPQAPGQGKICCNVGGEQVGLFCGACDPGFRDCTLDP